VVHGGGRYTTPVAIDAAVLADLERFVPLAPLHQPFALEGIRLFEAQRPGTLQVACFDTAFHHTLADVETMFALPRADWEDGVRRYGFHGLSYEFVAQAIHERHGPVALGRTIVAHLGSGASLCAMRELRSVATTMGFSALDGLMMGTRCGALDPGVILYLMETKKRSVERMAALLYHESGLLGMSGLSADPRVLLDREDELPAAQALALYVRYIVREVCSLASAIGGLDMLVFTAGIGEHNATIRERVCTQLGFLGLILDANANAAHASTISAADSRVLVAVEPTNEEWLAARAARSVLDGWR